MLEIPLLNSYGGEGRLFERKKSKNLFENKENENPEAFVCRLAIFPLRRVSDAKYLINEAHDV